jgi:ribonuclease HII
MSHPDPSLPLTYRPHLLEAGVDEAGRGCLAGPVVAAAVILPAAVELPGLTDSKQLNHQTRLRLRPLIIEQSLAWAVGMISARRIDQINILNATYEAMHEAIANLHIRPEGLAIDGNRFRPYPELPHACLVRGDSRYLNIAAASVLAKTYRDELMILLDQDYPVYSWASNKGYPTRAHKLAIEAHGPSPHHRRSFQWGIKRSLFEAP